jgi:hypothetical protein
MVNQNKKIAGQIKISGAIIKDFLSSSGSGTGSTQPREVN